jgi:DNA-binding GntR family transcriptional regulator
MVDLHSSVPRWRQVYEQLHDAITSGEIPAGARIPSKKAIVQETGVAANTVQHAIAELQAEGMLETVLGLGLFVLPRERWKR